jgi:hypothetical protein
VATPSDFALCEVDPGSLIDVPPEAAVEDRCTHLG